MFKNEVIEYALYYVEILFKKCTGLHILSSRSNRKSLYKIKHS